MDVFEAQLPWFISGPLLGLVVVGGYWATNQALGGVGSFAALGRFLAAPKEGASWRAYFLLGLVGGGLVYALVSGGIAPTFAYGSLDQSALGASLGFKAATLFGGGLLIGAGARYAGGCTLGHGLCGSATLSPSSLVSTATFMAAAILTAHALFAAGVLG